MWRRNIVLLVLVLPACNPFATNSERRIVYFHPNDLTSNAFGADAPIARVTASPWSPAIGELVRSLVVCSIDGAQCTAAAATRAPAGDYGEEEAAVEVDLAGNADWVFLGVRSGVQGLAFSSRVDGLGFGIRLTAASKPTPANLAVCRETAGGAYALLSFSEAIALAGSDAQLTVDGSPCVLQGAAGPNTRTIRFQCAALPATSVRVVVGANTVRAFESGTEMTTLTGARAFDATYAAGDAAAQSSEGCLGWHLQ